MPPRHPPCHPRNALAPPSPSSASPPTHRLSSACPNKLHGPRGTHNAAVRSQSREQVHGRERLICSATSESSWRRRARRNPEDKAAAEDEDSSDGHVSQSDSRHGFLQSSHTWVASQPTLGGSGRRHRWMQVAESQNRTNGKTVPAAIQGAWAYSAPTHRLCLPLPTSTHIRISPCTYTQTIHAFHRRRLPPTPAHRGRQRGAHSIQARVGARQIVRGMWKGWSAKNVSRCMRSKRRSAAARLGTEVVVEGEGQDEVEAKERVTITSALFGATPTYAGAQRAGSREWGVQCVWRVGAPQEGSGEAHEGGVGGGGGDERGEDRSAPLSRRTLLLHVMPAATVRGQSQQRDPGVAPLRRQRRREEPGRSQQREGTREQRRRKSDKYAPVWDTSSRCLPERRAAWAGRGGVSGTPGSIRSRAVRPGSKRMAIARARGGQTEDAYGLYWRGTARRCGGRSETPKSGLFSATGRGDVRNHPSRPTSQPHLGAYLDQQY
ncbi:hypothetical protein B0H19DRAFT_1073007 [Mycena capillaripes]|nr:hypothetical protein B0H19DRAFT_1073007 [Mycena capillaripes]